MRRRLSGALDLVVVVEPLADLLHDEGGSLRLDFNDTFASLEALC